MFIQICGFCPSAIRACRSRSVSLPRLTLLGRSSSSTPTSSGHRTASPSAAPPLRLDRIVIATISQGYELCLFCVCPFRYNTLVPGTQPHSKILPDSWRRTRRGLLAVCRRCNPWWDRSTCVWVGEEVPSDRHGFVRELFFSDFELYVLLPGIAFHCWGSGFDDVFFLWEDAIHLGGVCVLVFLEVVSHCRYLNYNNGI